MEITRSTDHKLEEIMEDHPARIMDQPGNVFSKIPKRKIEDSIILQFPALVGEIRN